MTAAAAVGPPTRPILLYYALSQAGRAIAAAHADNPAPHGHGLTVKDVEKDLLRTRVEPDGTGEFQIVAELTGSETLAAPAELGSLWASLPELVGTIDEEIWPVALRFQDNREDDLLAQKMAVGVEGRVFFEPKVRDREDLEVRMAKYPRAAGDYTVPAIPPHSDTITFSLGWVGMRWGDEETHVPTRRDEIAPEYRFEDERWVRPGVGENVDYLSPLMAWWALLYTLSVVARYHPAEWARSLRIDSSEIAAYLEHALEVALEVLPHLVLEAVWNDPVLLSR